VDAVLDGAGLRGYFRVIVNGHQVHNPKPHPEIYVRTAGLLGIAPPNCIVFEDSEAGLAAAQAAGMRTVGVTTTHEELPGVELSIRDFHDRALEPWLRAQAVAP
jgi:beta-phosphoglucomutase-like phosphatase (HAD superfamily)